jgi:hypothetical protein
MIDRQALATPVGPLSIGVRGVFSFSAHRDEFRNDFALRLPFPHALQFADSGYSGE